MCVCVLVYTFFSFIKSKSFLINIRIRPLSFTFTIRHELDDFFQTSHKCSVLFYAILVYNFPIQKLFRLNGNLCISVAYKIQCLPVHAFFIFLYWKQLSCFVIFIIYLRYYFRAVLYYLICHCLLVYLSIYLLSLSLYVVVNTFFTCLTRDTSSFAHIVWF